MVVDDNIRFADGLALGLREKGYTAQIARDIRTALETSRQVRLDLAIIDVMLGDENGLQLVDDLRRSYPSLPIIMITGFSSVAAAIEAIKRGANEYLQKPVDWTLLAALLDRYAPLRIKIGSSPDPVSSSPHSRSPRVQALMETSARLAATDLPILILGENGAGKERIADFIHERSNRRHREIVRINCAALPESLLENELFGHEKGAYTGADGPYRGVFEQAHESTLFLDEIGDMAPSIQAKLLRVIQDGEIRPLGSTRKKTVDVRFVAATNHDLERAVEERRFREDLYYRLNAAVLKLPPLRERMEDLPSLVRQFVEEFNAGHDKRVHATSPAVLELLTAYPWPGNIRELRNVVRYAAAIDTDDILDLDDLPERLLTAATMGRMHGRTVTGRRPGTLAEAERRHILATLASNHNNKRRTAAALGISRNTLYNKLRRLEIDGVADG